MARWIQERRWPVSRRASRSRGVASSSQDTHVLEVLREDAVKSLLQSLYALSVRDGDLIVVAVSGGADSVCLLHRLRQLKRFPLHVAHLNHQFRKEADAEARFVEQLAAQWNLPVTIESWPVEALCKRERLSRQEGARRARYRFLTACADRVGARWIATGHTADDQAETVLMRLLRGSGRLGLSGIPKLRADRIIRPILTMTRQEVTAELARAGIPHIEDLSNAKPVYLRNRIRHQLLPQLQADNPNILATLCRMANLLGEEDAFLRQYTQQQMSRVCLEKTEQSVLFDVVQLQALHPAIQRRMIQAGLAHIYICLAGPDNSRHVGFAQIEKLVGLLDGPSGRRFSLPGGVSVRRDYGRLILERADTQPVPPPPVEITGGEHSMNLPAWGIRLTMEQRYKPPFRHVAAFDLDRVVPPLILRGWRAGDRFVPVGMGGRHKKLQDFFSDAKIPRPERFRIPLLTCEGAVLWIVGHRADARFMASEKTEHVLSLEAQPLHDAG